MTITLEHCLEFERLLSRIQIAEMQLTAALLERMHEDLEDPDPFLRVLAPLIRAGGVAPEGARRELVNALRAITCLRGGTYGELPEAQQVEEVSSKVVERAREYHTAASRKLQEAPASQDRDDDSDDYGKGALTEASEELTRPTSQRRNSQLALEAIVELNRLHPGTEVEARVEKEVREHIERTYGSGPFEPAAEDSCDE